MGKLFAGEPANIGVKAVSIAQQIAAKRAELAVFVTESAQAVLAEPMTEEARGVVALNLLKLMVASVLGAQAGPMIDITPEKPQAITQDACRAGAVRRPSRWRRRSPQVHGRAAAGCGPGIRQRQWRHRRQIRCGPRIHRPAPTAARSAEPEASSTVRRTV